MRVGNHERDQTHEQRDREERVEVQASPVSLAAKALAALDQGDEAGFDAILAPTLPLARHLFSEPTSAYKTGIVFLAWLAGHQDHFRMVGGLETGRDATHLRELHHLALPAGVLDDPGLAAERLAAVLG